LRHIIHADLDAFYAAVEQLDNPELVGKPVLVGGRPENRGVVATASYEARVFGVHSAMPMRTAVHRCPQGIIVPPRFSRYKEKSGEVMSIFRDLTDLVEPLSMDEAYLDITAVVDGGEKPLAVALDLKRRIFDETGLIVSVGVGTCKTVAKIGSDLDKPDGLVVVQPGDEAEFLGPLAVSKLWGIGPKTAERLHGEGIKTIGQLADQPLEWFARTFGKRSASVRDKAMGRDADAVHTESASKSISSETTFVTDTLVPALKRGDTVIMDNLGAHKVAGVRQAIQAVGAKLLYLPPYSPDLNPIEQIFAKLKGHLRKAAARTLPDLKEAVRSAFDTLTPKACRNCLAAAGYDAYDPT